MKKTLIRVLAVLLLLAGICTLAACKKNTAAPDGMQDVTAGTMNEFYRLYAPESWISQASSGISGARVSNTDTSNVTVVMTMPTEQESIPAYWETKCVPAYQQQFGSIALDQALCVDTTLGAISAKQYAFSYTLDGVSCKILQIFVFNGGYLYTLTYTATEQNFPNHLEEVEAIRAAFTFV